MSNNQNLRWKRKAIAVTALAVSFAGYAAIGSSTVSAEDHAGWECSDSDPLAISGSSNELCTAVETPDTVPSYDSVPDTVPVDTLPVVTDPPATDPPATQPPATNAPQQIPAAPTSAAPTFATPSVAPSIAPQVVRAPVLPVTGRGSALPTAFIAVGLLGAGSVALAFARRNAATRNNEA